MPCGCRKSCCSRRRSRRSRPITRNSSRAGRRSRRWRRRAATTCCAPGPGSAITRARAICTPARKPWSPITAARFRTTSTRLRGLPGIGDYTAAAIAAIAFDRPAVPVDGNVERVVSRLFAVEQELPAAKPLIKEFAAIIIAAPPRRRFRAGADGSRRHALHAQAAGLRAAVLGTAHVWRRARGDARRPSRARRPSAKASCAAAPLSSRCAPTDACCCAGGPTRACSPP